jgi:hypothetical protein
MGHPTLGLLAGATGGGALSIATAAAAHTRSARRRRLLGTGSRRLRRNELELRIEHDRLIAEQIENMQQVSVGGLAIGARA